MAEDEPGGQQQPAEGAAVAPTKRRGGRPKGYKLTRTLAANADKARAQYDAAAAAAAAEGAGEDEQAAAVEAQAAAQAAMALLEERQEQERRQAELKASRGSGGGSKGRGRGGAAGAGKGKYQNSSNIAAIPTNRWWGKPLFSQMCKLIEQRLRASPGITLAQLLPVLLDDAQSGVQGLGQWLRAEKLDVRGGERLQTVFKDLVKSARTWAFMFEVMGVQDPLIEG